MRALLASPLGFMIGISLGAVGGGGSILAVPVFVFVVGQSAKDATASSLFVVGLTSLAGLAPHARAGRTRVGAGLLFGLAGVGGSFLGADLSKRVNKNVLLLAFAALVVVAAVAMWGRTRTVPSAAAVAAAATVAHAAATSASTALGSAVGAARTELRVTPGTVAKVTAAGSVVGFLTGFFGVGGGFVIVPALVLALGFTMAEAAGTSLLVIAINTAVSIAIKWNTVHFEWSTIIPFAVASLLGVVVGSRIADRVDGRRLTRAFVVLLVVVACYTAIRAGLALR